MKKHTIVILVLILTLIAAIQTVSVIKSRSAQAAQSISTTDTSPNPEKPEPIKIPTLLLETPASSPELPTSPKPSPKIQPTITPKSILTSTPTPKVTRPTKTPQAAVVKAAPVVVAPQAPAPTPSTPTGSNDNPTPKQIDNVSTVPKLTFPDCSQSDFNSKFLCLINNYRAENGKSALRYDSTLNRVALNYSGYMQSSNFFGHVGPDGSHYYERCAAAGTSCHAENLAEGFLSAQNLFDMWRSSPGHNTNMLGPYTSIGLGTSGKYATNVFKW